MKSRMAKSYIRKLKIPKFSLAMYKGNTKEMHKPCIVLPVYN